MIVGGCKSKNGGADEVTDAAVSISKKNYGDIGDVLKVPTRKVSADESEKVLKAIGLWDESNALTWEDRSGGEGTYVFKNISTTDEEGQTFKAKRLTLAGLHMEGDTPVADLVDMGDLSLNGDDVSLTIENLGLTDVVLSENIGALSDIDDLLDFADLDLDIGDGTDSRAPKSFVMTGVKGQSDEAEFVIENLGWGQDPKTSELRFAAEDLSITSLGEDSMTITLDSAKVRGMADDTDAALSGSGGHIVDILTQSQGFGDVELKGFELKSDVVNLNLPSLNQSVTDKGNIRETDFNMPSFTVALIEGDNVPPDVAQGLAMLKSLGFDELVFSSKGQTELNTKTDVMTIKAVSVDLKDGFDLNYKGEISGFSAIKELGAEASAAEFKAAQDNIKVHDFALSLEDKSIVERGFKLAGEMTGQTPKDLRRQANGVLALGSLAALTQDDGAIYSEFTKALGEFIQDGGTLNIAVNPQTPLTLDDFDELSRGKKPDLKRLGFSASTTQ